jgi:hypothetical protein
MSSTYSERTHAWVTSVRRVARTDWSDWIGWIALGFSVAYAALGIWWSLGGGGYPFGPDGDPQAALSILGGVGREIGAPAIAAVGAASALAAVLMIRRTTDHPLLRRILPAFGMALGLTAAVLVPDYRILVAVAYAPIFLVAAPFGLTGDASFFDAVTPIVLHQVAIMVGGIAWIGLSVVYSRVLAGACARCGRGAGPRWTEPGAAARWGRWAVVVAVVIPLVYAATRWAWALGIPLGVTDEFLREGAGNGMWLAGAALGTIAVGGALLTTGLTLRWGERFPEWLPVVGGRSVPIALAVVPAIIVAAIVASAGTMFIRMTLTGADFGGLAEWGALGPELLWPAWAVALAAAAVAYGLRRQGRCRTCGRGS